MDIDTQVKLAIYRHFASTGSKPSLADVIKLTDMDADSVLGAYSRLRALRVLVMEADGSTIRMAPPFSGIPTPHIVLSGGKQYFANCAWAALGVLAALHQPGEVHSQCAQSGEQLRLRVSLDGPEPSDWLFHCLVPAARWWEDIVFT